MTDPMDGEIRSLVATLIESSPLPPPFPTIPSGPGSRRPRRAVVAAIVVTALIGAAVYGVIARTTTMTRVTTGPGRSPADQVIVVDDGSARTTLIDFDSGMTHVVDLPHRVGGDFPYAILATGGFLVYVGDRGTWATPISGAGSPTNLGKASYIVPSSTAGRVWLVTTAESVQPVPGTAEEVGVDGRYRSRVFRVPAGDAVITGATGGVLLDTANGAALWNPVTGHLGNVLVSVHRSDLVDVHGSLVAWVECSPTGACSTVHVADLATGHSRSYPAPSGTSGWVSTAGQGSRDAFSPDGQYLAVRATSSRVAAQPSNGYVIRLATGATMLLPTTSASPHSRVAWLTVGTWVVSQHANGTLQTNDILDGATRTFAGSRNAVALLTTTR